MSIEKATAITEIRNVSKTFYTEDVETHALSDVSLSIQRGEYVSIVGPSGCGKSTLLSILGLLEKPTSGEYFILGDPVEQLTATQRADLRNRSIGFIFQSFQLIGDMSVVQNVELPLYYRGMKPKERRDRAMAALERVDMGHRTKHRPSQLSGGQQQRVAVARALAGGPEILLADEPTGNLDSENGERVMGILADLHKDGATICMVTHDERYSHSAPRVIHLFDGKLDNQALSTTR